MSCPFKAGDVVVGPMKGVYWFINGEQYVGIEIYEYGEREGHKGLYLASGATKMNWDSYIKICTITEINQALRKLANDKD